MANHWHCCLVGPTAMMACTSDKNVSHSQPLDNLMLEIKFYNAHIYCYLTVTRKGIGPRKYYYLLEYVEL